MLPESGGESSETSNLVGASCLRSSNVTFLKLLTGGKSYSISWTGVEALNAVVDAEQE